MKSQKTHFVAHFLKNIDDLCYAKDLYFSPSTNMYKEKASIFRLLKPVAKMKVSLWYSKFCTLYM